MELVEIVNVVVMSVVFLSLGVRLTPLTPKPSGLIIAIHVVLIFTMIMGLSPVYNRVDAWLGGISLANVLTHSLFAGAAWMVSRLIGRSLKTPEEHPVWLRGWVLVAAILGIVTLYFSLDVEVTSRGLDHYNGVVFYPLYWTATYLPFLVSSVWLVPRLWKAIRTRGYRRVRIPYIALLTCYLSVWPTVTMYFLASWWPSIIPLREAFVIFSGVSIMLGFLTLPFSGKKGKVGRRRRHPTSEAQADLKPSVLAQRYARPTHHHRDRYERD